MWDFFNLLLSVFSFSTDLRFGISLCPEEKEFVSKRKGHVLQGLRNFLNDRDQNHKAINYEQVKESLGRKKKVFFVLQMGEDIIGKTFYTVVSKCISIILLQHFLILMTKIEILMKIK